MYLHSLTLANIKHAVCTLFDTATSGTALILSSACVFIDAVLFRGDYVSVYLILSALVLDTVLGVVVGWHRHALSSREFWRVVPKLTVYLILYVLTLIVDVSVQRMMGITTLTVFSSFITFFIVTTELLSVIENAGKLGVETPAWLVERIRNIRKHPEKIGSALLSEEKPH